MLRAALFVLFFSIASICYSAPVTGPIANATILAYKPTATIDTAGLSRLNLPVLAGETAGVATIGTKATVGRLLGAAGRGVLGPWGMTAITAAQLCYEQTDWKICHSSIEPILPINIDSSSIVPASQSPIYNYYTKDFSSSMYSSADSACSAATAKFFISNSSWATSSSYSIGGNLCFSYGITSSGVKIQMSVSTYNTISEVNTNQLSYSCSSGSILTNSSGAPMAVTGQYCTPESAYSCPTNYARSDSYGNLGSGMFCSYQSPALTEQQKADILAPYLLNYYANQLFADKDGKTLPDIFSDADTTFDPTVTPADMPMTWEDLKTYTDWITSGKGQTTNPLAPYYISPSNYKYTQTVINNTNNTNTNTDTTTNVNPTTTASSAAMTQAQFEQSTSKADKTAADAINATDISSLDNLASGSGGFNDANDQLKDISNGDIGDLPSLPTPNLPGYSSCLTIDLSWKGHPAAFPSPSQCLKMEEAKKAFGYILYLMTFLGLVYELLRRVE